MQMECVLKNILIKTSGKEYVGGVEGLKERIQQESKAETPCSLFVGMVSAHQHQHHQYHAQQPYVKA